MTEYSVREMENNGTVRAALVPKERKSLFVVDTGCVTNFLKFKIFITIVIKLRT